MRENLHGTFFYARNPLCTLAYTGFLIFASSRLAFALTAAAALIWVYVLTALAVSSLWRFLPKVGKIIILFFLSSFMAVLFLFGLMFASPLLGAELVYLIILTPCCFMSAFSSERMKTMSVGGFLSETLRESLVTGGILVALSFIREPIGFMSLSIPGGAHGVIELFNSSDKESFLPVRIVTSVSGGCLLLGYISAVFFTIKRQIMEGVQ
jgi:hypothetical protein